MALNIKPLSLTIILIIISLVGTSFGAPDIPALKDCNSAAERTRVEKLIKGAQAEGKLVWLGVMVEPKHAKYIIEGFKSYCGLPDLVCEYTYGDTSRMVARTEQLIKAKRPTPDIIWSAGWPWFRSLQSRGEIMNYECPYYKDYSLSDAAGLSVPGYWVSDAYSFSPMYNPEAVAKAGIKNFNPTSWWDFTGPEMKKLLTVGNISQSISFSIAAVGMKKKLGLKYFEALAKLKPTLYNKTSQARDWVGSGEYPISLHHHAKNANVLAKSGINVKLVYPKEGIVMIPFSAVILTRAEHPNTSKLFIDYIRSAKGTQQVVDSGAWIFFGRPGVKSPNPDLLPAWENVNFIPVDMDKECSEGPIQAIQQEMIDVGLSY